MTQDTLSLLTEEEFEDLVSEMADHHLRFCYEYVIDMNKVRAARVSGYTNRQPRKAASRLLMDPKITKLINHLKAERIERAKLTASHVLDELMAIGFGNIRNLIELDANGQIKIKNIADLDAKTTANVKNIKITESALGSTVTDITTHDKLKALELLGKHLSLFTDKVDVTSKGDKLNNTPLNITVNHRTAESEDE